MNAEIFAEWLRRQGDHVIKTASTYWHSKGLRVFQAFPYHWIISPSENEIKEFLVQQGVVGLRYSTPLDSNEGMVSYHGVLGERPYDLSILSANSRSKVRRGMNRCKIEQISLDMLAKDGWLLQQDTTVRQGRSGISQSDWQRICFAAKGLLGFDVWGGFVNGELAATILTAQVDTVCYMLYPQSHRKFFSDYVNNVLSFEVTREMLSRDDVKEVFYGLHSLDAPPSVDEFKFSMGYKARPLRQRVAFHPVLKPLANKINYAMIAKSLKLRPNNTILAKGEGMLRFHLFGKLGLQQQQWPECLTLYKEK